jgi:hypothetical protein
VNGLPIVIAGLTGMLVALALYRSARWRWA